MGVPEPDLKGLVEGVGREVWGSREGPDNRPGGAATGEKREGRVPARARPCRWPADAVSGMALLKSGKLSPLGDSGMVSRNGVELPLVGGPPHNCGVTPSCAWISRALSINVSENRALFQGATNRLENSRLPYSCDGDPAPSLVPAAALPSGFDVFVGKRIEPLFGGSTGDVLPVEEPECGPWGVNWGM